ncbi:hypothetical protein QIH87_50155 (plasmid) [Bradyrhizobium elkanii]|jgi:repressor LexA|uniref:LexA family protein n=1 Tax=Bradyrhizobium elkanii TaxID=29448 RepID=UPI00271492F8|nr:hypothetical protein [Bradyrhizobium elkanii]WLA80345.1 hypothetical protein QNJ99_33915 [Bradyrhizobium elkanii]WLB14796.1 hypothetical protein QIH87_50155 [Bradyrhizobium elkanii]WLB69113.1 hypothetical protein QIH89_27765 [Bradyrhizobium elkanii]
MKLTPRESQVLSFVSTYIETCDRAPKQDQIAGALGLRSRTYVQRVLGRLEAKGRIRLAPYKIRGIEIVRSAA